VDGAEHAWHTGGAAGRGPYAGRSSAAETGGARGRAAACRAAHRADYPGPVDTGAEGYHRAADATEWYCAEPLHHHAEPSRTLRAARAVRHIPPARQPAGRRDARTAYHAHGVEYPRRV